MISLSWRFIRMWQRNRDVFLRLWRSEAPGFVAEPIIVIMSLGAGLGAYIGLVSGRSYIEFIAPGIISGYAMYAAVFEGTYGAFVRMSYQNTYDAILATPLNAEDIITGEIAWGATRALLTGTAVLAIAAVFRLVPSFWALLIPPFSFLQGFMFGAISLLYTSVVPAMSTFNYFYTLFVNPMFFISGVFFPLDSLPEIVQRLSWISPLTAVVYVNRALFQGQFGAQFLLSLIIVLVITAVFFYMSLLMMKRRLTR